MATNKVDLGKINFVKYEESMYQKISKNLVPWIEGPGSCVTII